VRAKDDPTPELAYLLLTQSSVLQHPGLTNEMRALLSVESVKLAQVYAEQTGWVSTRPADDDAGPRVIDWVDMKAVLKHARQRVISAMIDGWLPIDPTEPVFLAERED
jgi:hypothetical protein